MNIEKHHEIIGGLLDAAMRDQIAIQHAVEGMKTATAAQYAAARDLPGKVAKSVSDAIEPAVNIAAEKVVKHFVDANRDADRAALAFQRAAKFSMTWIVGAALGIASVGAAAIVAVAWMLAPTSLEIQAIRDERAQLQRDIVAFEDRGARIDFTRCQLSSNEPKTRLCARLDPVFEKDIWNGGYRILKDK
jgi:hypothetical protein